MARLPRYLETRISLLYLLGLESAMQQVNLLYGIARSAQPG